MCLSKGKGKVVVVIVAVVIMALVVVVVVVRSSLPPFPCKWMYFCKQRSHLKIRR